MTENNKSEIINVQFSHGYTSQDTGHYDCDVWEVTIGNQIWVFDEYTSVIEVCILNVGPLEMSFQDEENNRYWKGVEAVITVKRFGPAGWAFSDEDSIPLSEVWNALVNPPPVFVESDEDLPF